MGQACSYTPSNSSEFRPQLDRNNDIVVAGSMNIDYFFKVDDLPQPGETIASKGFSKEFGGKGANQAIACARLGA